MNRYLDEELVRRRLETEGHRAVVGGLWETMGGLQLDFLKTQGLQPRHALLDIGCGALRAGVRLAAYLDEGRYYGLDVSEALIEAGWRDEVIPMGLADRLPRANLHVTPDFEVPFGVVFDYGLATSVFTHLTLEHLPRCLERIAPAFAPGGVVYVTVFEGRGTVARPDGVVTHDDRDPFHFTREAIAAVVPAGWAMSWIGDWGHPREQQMVRFSRV